MPWWSLWPASGLPPKMGTGREAFSPHTSSFSAGGVASCNALKYAGYGCGQGGVAVTSGGAAASKTVAHSAVVMRALFMRLCEVETNFARELLGRYYWQYLVLQYVSMISWE